MSDENRVPLTDEEMAALRGQLQGIIDDIRDLTIQAKQLGERISDEQSYRERHRENGGTVHRFRPRPSGGGFDSSSLC